MPNRIQNIAGGVRGCRQKRSYEARDSARRECLAVCQNYGDEHCNRFRKLCVLSSNSETKRIEVKRYIKAIELAVQRYWVQLKKVKEVDNNLENSLARIFLHSIHIHALLFKEILLNYGEVIEVEEEFAKTTELIQHLEET